MLHFLKTMKREGQSSTCDNGLSLLILPLNKLPARQVKRCLVCAEAYLICRIK